MIDKLLLLSGEDIPFQEITMTVHPPKLKDIALLNETPFYRACNTLLFSKDNLSSEDKINLENTTNFEIIMSMITENSDIKTRENSVYVKWLFSLLFPMCQLNFTRQGIVIIQPDDKMPHIISNENYDKFKEIIEEIFCLNQSKSELDYNTKDARGNAIKEKLLEGRRKAAAAKGQNADKPTTILNRYISILSIGNHQSINEILNYTVYQLFDAFERMQLKQQQDFYIKAKMAGASELKEVDDWMKELHS